MLAAPAEIKSWLQGPVVVMDYVPGVSLKQRQDHPAPGPESSKILQDLVAGPFTRPT